MGRTAFPRVRRTTPSASSLILLLTMPEKTRSMMNVTVVRNAAKSATPRVTKNHTREFGSNRGADASHVRTEATRARRARMQSVGDSVVREWHCVIEV